MAQITKVIAAATALSMTAALLWLFAGMMSGDPWRILFCSVLMLTIAVIALTFLRAVVSVKGPEKTPVPERTANMWSKKCISCGAVMDEAADSCPKCSAAQPEFHGPPGAKRNK